MDIPSHCSILKSYFYSPKIEIGMTHTYTPTAATLLLADGTVFKGKSLGKIGTAIGELCFNTGMTGYQEVFTDPSYTGQVVIMNNVHVGNYGTKETDVESESVKIKGLICRSLEEQFSRIQSKKNLHDYLFENN